MKTVNSSFLKVFYSVFFILVLPVLLWLWSIYIDRTNQIPGFQPSVWGLVLLAGGLLLMLWGMYSIITYGKGLPMNAYPPEKLVTQGPYHFLRHPIYWGFGLALMGASLYLGSAGGLWLVSPVLILAMMALVWGHERIQLQQRFLDYNQPVFFSLPENSNEKALWNQRMNALLVPAFFWMLSNAIILFLYGNLVSSIRERGFIGFLPFSGEINWIILLFFLLVPFLPLRKSGFRDWTISALWANFLIFFVALLWPEVGAQFHFEKGIVLEKEAVFQMKLPRFDLLVFHGCWILLLGRIFCKAFSRLSFLIWCCTLILFMNHMGLSKWPLVNAMISLVIYLIIIKRIIIWAKLRYSAERIANSWKEWVIGPIRIINHGFYVGVAAFLGVVLTGWLVGSSYVWAIVIFGLVVIIFSALWAQFIEGSEKLKRPFGYYGALVGIIFSALVVRLLGYDMWVIIGVISVFMPWVQAIGRLRCLINGCCHGDITQTEGLGIRYFHPRSRVCGLSELKGELLHPTPLYAIIWLFLIGLILLSLWFREVSYPMIFGLYLILSGIGRFVEEAYRGEIQTPIIFGLRLYQWTAILSVIVGMIMTVINVTREEIEPIYEIDIIYAALTLGMFTFFAMGVDFPKSNLRFSRLV